jgi:hypothetical protein
MQRIVDPRQSCLFDPYASVLTETTRRRLLDGWAGVFRPVILELMPVNALRGNDRAHRSQACRRENWLCFSEPIFGANSP